MLDSGFAKDYIKIAEHYGLDFQRLKLAEECAEYAATTLKSVGYQMLMNRADSERVRRHFLDKWINSRAEVDKELADVLVLARQIEWLLNNESAAGPREVIEEEMKGKVQRQLNRIEEEEIK